MSLFRALRVLHVFARYRIDKFFPTLRGIFLIKLFVLLSPSAWSVTSRYTRGERIRLTLETLGPIFIKFGQIISTRRDLLSDDIADELVKLQDSVPPFASEIAVNIMETTYGKEWRTIFTDFSITPLASASIAQVHTATLPTGEEIVVKIVRPTIKETITKDIQLLYFLARWVKRLLRDSKRLRPMEVVAEFEKTIFDELNMLREGANASQLRHNFENSPMIYVPKVYFDVTRENILVIERVYGVQISDIATLKKSGVDMEKLARYGVEIFMTQVFRDSFFHADMHPGNVFVDIKDPQNPQYCAIDFGIIGMLSDEDLNYLAGNFLAFFNRDYRRIAQLHLESGWVPANTNILDFEMAVRTVYEPIFQKPLSEVSFADMVLQLLKIARRFEMEVQPQLLLLQKTLFNIEGLGRELYPDLDLWDTMKPFLENWMRERVGVVATIKKLFKTLISRIK
jgi:ubiquinone biosynthesis protein